MVAIRVKRLMTLGANCLSILASSTICFKRPRSFAAFRNLGAKIISVDHKTSCINLTETPLRYPLASRLQTHPDGTRNCAGMRSVKFARRYLKSRKIAAPIVNAAPARKTMMDTLNIFEIKLRTHI